jgi:peptidyl-prolyl cis-trans isomerase B (cyclophilin B)
MKNGLKISIAFAAAIVMLAGAAYITKASSIMGTGPKYTPPISGTKLDELTAHPKRHLVIVTAQGTIKLQLFEKIAPRHAANIINLATTHFYDSTYFHRVIPGFMIQGGDPNTKDNDFSNDGQGSGPQMLTAEFNATHHSRGILSMARANDPNSASSQFFICVADAGFLDKQYTAFGQVIDGMDVVDKIVNLPDVTSRPQAQVQQGGINPGRAAEILSMYVEGN